MAKAKFMNGEFSAKFKGKRKFVAEQMAAIKDYAARDDMQINICPVIQERPSEKKNTEEQITPTHFISGNLEHPFFYLHIFLQRSLQYGALIYAHLSLIYFF